MLMIALMAAIGLVAYLPQFVWGPRRDWRMPMRHGMAAVFLYTGSDHFLSLHERYVPMIPPYLADWAVELVLISGALELAGALGLLLPLVVWRRLGWPNLRPVAGVGLAMLLSVMVIANSHVAAAGGSIPGLPDSTLYYATRPLFQPFIVLWALVCSGAVMPPRAADASR
ncbi:MAG: DoxX family protein [Alphaproteobacteria bacterium]